MLPVPELEISLESEAELVALSLKGGEGAKELLEAMAESASFDMKAALRGARRP